MLHYWLTLGLLMYVHFSSVEKVCSIPFRFYGHSWIVHLFCFSITIKVSSKSNPASLWSQLNCPVSSWPHLHFAFTRLSASCQILCSLPLFLTPVLILSGEKRWPTFIFKWLFLRFFMKLKVWKALHEHNAPLHREGKALWIWDGRRRKEGKWDKVRRKKCALVWKGVQNLCWCKQDGYQMGFVSRRGEHKEGNS